MAVLAAAALLDELMGRNRNIAPNDKAKELNWEDPEYCKLYLVKFCPHDLFVNTRADLGQCPKVHDDEVKALYEKSTSYKKQQYEDEFIRFCQSMLNEVERKIIKGKQRLALIGKSDTVSLSPAQTHRNEEQIKFLTEKINKLVDEVSLSPAQTQRNEEQIKFLTEKINKLVDEAEQMGIQGNVEQAQGLMKLCDQLKEEREQLRGSNENSHWQQTAELAAAQEKQMEVCDVCGAFLIVGDAQQRIDDHLMGKQHVGYARLKMAMEELINNRQKSRDDKERRREEERRERMRMREEEERRREREREERRRKREDEERSRHRPKHRSRSPRMSQQYRRSRSRSGRHAGREEKSRGSRHSRSKSLDRGRDHRRRVDDHDREHHRRSDRGLNGDYGRHSPLSRRSSSHHHDSKSNRGLGKE